MFGRAPVGPRKEAVTTYRHVYNSKRKVHQLRAELALGHKLPPKAIVHHADGTISENGPLVICENQAYHMFLHMLMRIKARGGDPHAQRICTGCKRVLAFANFGGSCLIRKPGKAFRCRECQKALSRASYLRKLQKRYAVAA